MISNSGGWSGFPVVAYSMVMPLAAAEVIGAG
jgi:hypothetical protein